MSKGSNKRKRTKFVIARLTPGGTRRHHGDRRQARHLARRLIRQTLLDVAARRPASAAPPPTSKLLAKVLAELGKIGSNINQIAYHLNAGRPGRRDARAASRAP